VFLIQQKNKLLTCQTGEILCKLVKYRFSLKQGFNLNTIHPN
jgi:hypothetical protein